MSDSSSIPAFSYNIPLKPNISEMSNAMKSRDVEAKKRGEIPAPITAVLKAQMHCDGCEARIVMAARRIRGVETVKSDRASSKLTVVGFMDPSKLRDDLQNKTRKKIELISPQPKKENGNKKLINQKLNDEKNPKKPAVSTAVLKLNFHCQGCTDRIHRLLSKTKGVYDVEMDKEKEHVTVTGITDVKFLTERLKQKLKRNVEILPPKKEKHNKRDGVSSGGGNNTKNQEGIGAGSPGQPDFGYVSEFGVPFGPCGYPFRPDEIFSDENANACSIM